MPPYVVTISSEKGGVGKTTLATNLAIYLKALSEETPVTLLSFDNHFSVDRMFRLDRQPAAGTVADLFAGRSPEELVQWGQFGVQFIPSSADLAKRRDRITGPGQLAACLAQSAQTGLFIIDTRPDLDIFTQNALFAADRVIVPVKDAPSLENCRHLYDFFDRHGLSRRPLRLLPCLIDSRIRFDGPFRDAYRLLKGYAINRGYRCLEGYIAKSPKVESLNTNPDGRIYPILTHGRQTEVHRQFTHLARQVFLGYRDAEERRLEAVGRAMAERSDSRERAFQERRRSLAPHCLACGRRVVSEQGVAPVGYFAETFPGGRIGFLEEECFTDLVFQNFYAPDRATPAAASVRDLFRETARRSFFVLRRAPHTKSFYRPQVAFHRFDEDGQEISRRTVSLEEYRSKLLAKGERTLLYQLVARTLFDPEDRLSESCLLIGKVGIDYPEEILFDESYLPWQRMGARILEQMQQDMPNQGALTTSTTG